MTRRKYVTELPGWSTKPKGVSSSFPVYSVDFEG
jgi:hypothetical protein